jgi:hypothetical protein
MRACPRCGARPLYIVDGSRWQGARDRGTDQRGARRHDEAVGDEEPPRSPLPPSDPSPLPMSEDERGRRSVGLAASLVIGLIVVGVIFARTTHDEPNGRSGLAGLRPSEASALPGISPLLPHDPFNRDVVTRSVDHVLDLDTGQVTPLPRAILRSLGETAEGPSAESWYAAAPGGKQLAYVGTDGQGKRQIFVAGRSAGESSPGVAGSPVRQVTHDPAGATQPAWSPDGTMIAYEGYGGGEVRNLFVLDVARWRIGRVHGRQRPAERDPNRAGGGGQVEAAHRRGDRSHQRTAGEREQRRHLAGWFARDVRWERVRSPWAGSVRCERGRHRPACAPRIRVGSRGKLVPRRESDRVLGRSQLPGGRAGSQGRHPRRRRRDGACLPRGPW